MGRVQVKNVLSSDLVGQGLTLRPNETHDFATACEAVRFINTANAAVLDDGSGEMVDAVNRLAEREGCPERVQPLVVPRNDGAGDPAPPPTGDTPQTQGAPEGQPSAQVEHRNGDYGEPGEHRQPSDAMHDRYNPQTEDQIRDGATVQGATTQQANDQANRARRGEPTGGESRTTHSGSRAQTQSRTGDPVDLFSGLFVISSVDLDVPPSEASGPSFTPPCSTCSAASSTRRSR